MSAGPSPAPFNVMNSLGAIPPVWRVAALNTLGLLPAVPICGPMTGVNLRIRLLPRSAMKMSPARPKATPLANANSAAMAGPLSPAKPQFPSPATVVMMPARSTMRTRALKLSAMTRRPVASTATSDGPFSSARVAGPPSPLKPPPLKPTPLPATVPIAPSTVTFRIRLFQ